MSVALCLTVRNEAATVDELFATIAAQTRKPDCIVVVDGGSTDDTVEKIDAWRARGLPIEVMVEPGANISRGRNLAISRAGAVIIAVTDAGVRLDPGWLAALAAPFEAADPPDVVSGFYVADPRSSFELALGATTLPAVADIDLERFLPSSRSVAFRRSAWAQVGGYPEWLDYCEDLVFDFALKEAGYRFAWAPEAVVHFRPRSSPRAFFLQYYRYARGDGKADLWRRRHALRYATYLGLPICLVLARRHRWLLVPLVVAAAGYLRRPYARLCPSLAMLPPRDAVDALAWVPIIRLIGDVAKMMGYPMGVTHRARQHSQVGIGSSERPLSVDEQN